MFRLINLVAIALFIIMTVILIKYRLVFEITVDGEKLGYIADKKQFEQSINEFIDKKENNKLYTKIAQMPSFELTFVDKSEQTKEEEILAKIEKDSETMYKLYAVTVNGKEQATIANLEEAESLVKELNKKYKNKSNIKIAIIDVITSDNKKDVVTVKKAKTNIVNAINASTKKTYTKKVTYNYTTSKRATSSKVTKLASLNGIKFTVTPISGIITSRFGSRESIRSSSHSGLDIAAPKGTPIKAAADGTVIFAGTSGGYGKMIKISHGNGVVTFYGHCSALYAKVGQTISAGDVIAAVGATGHATGNHLHFEVLKNGVSINPQKFLY